jgi:hypothetical protein
MLPETMKRNTFKQKKRDTPECVSNILKMPSLALISIPIKVQNKLMFLNHPEKTSRINHLNVSGAARSQ